MFSKLMKVQLLNITDNEKTDSTLLIQIMLITIVSQYHFKYVILKEACFRYQQSLVTYRKQYSLVGRKSNYK